MLLIEMINVNRMNAKMKGEKELSNVLTTLKGEIERKYRNASDSEVKEVITASLKALNVMIIAKTDAGLDTSAETFEQQALQQYMPTKMSAEQTLHEVKTAIAETGATSLKDIGKVMGFLSKFSDTIDKGIASQYVKSELS